MDGIVGRGRAGRLVADCSAEVVVDGFDVLGAIAYKVWVSAVKSTMRIIPQKKEITMHVPDEMSS